MAGAVAEAGTAQEAASLLKAGLAILSNGCVGTLAGRTHAHNPLSQARFAD
jgi:hypothetical protein